MLWAEPIQTLRSFSSLMSKVPIRGADRSTARGRMPQGLFDLRRSHPTRTIAQLAAPQAPQPPFPQSIFMSEGAPQALGVYCD